MKLVVNKFGGTSVGTSQAMRTVAEILINQERNLAVLSACSGITNKLIQIANRSLNNLVEAENLIQDVKLFHLNLADELGVINESKSEIILIIDEISNLAKATNQIQEIQSSVEKRIISKGELLSTLIFVNFIKFGLQKQATIVFAPDFISFDGIEYIFRNQTKLLKKIQENHICITQGFIASDTKGTITNLGRGGSDWSAAIFGAELEAEMINIWTDVDGVLTSDPRVVDNTVLLPEIDYSSIKTASMLGAKVIHPETIAPAMEKEIGVKILNTFNQNSLGTFICKKTNYNSTIITLKKEILLIKLSDYSSFEKFYNLLINANITVYYLQEFGNIFTIYLDSSSSNLSFIIDNYLSNEIKLVQCEMIGFITTGNLESENSPNNIEISNLLTIFDKKELISYFPNVNNRTNLFFVVQGKSENYANLLHKKLSDR